MTVGIRGGTPYAEGAMNRLSVGIASPVELALGAFLALAMIALIGMITFLV